MRADREIAGMPILMLAARDDDPLILSALEAGADDYVVLGCATEILLCRLRRLVRDRQLAASAVINEQLAQVGRLLTGIVHEIRGPLSVIRGQAEMLQMTLHGEHRYVKHLDPILRNAQLLQARLEHLMAAVRSGPSALIEVPLDQLVREACDLFLKGADPRRNQIAVTIELTEGLPPARADAGRLIQVLMNLLANAREAILDAGRPGRIRVRSTLVHDGDDQWDVVEVADDGPGIPDDQLDRIFEPFFTTKAEGSGYGLYLASEILREHGGRLTASRSDLGGACFMLWLPTEANPPSVSS